MTPLERAAMALYARSYRAKLPGPPPPAWSALSRRDRDGFAEAARAVLQAIREPSEAMTKAGSAVLPGIPRPQTEMDSELAWQAMIDAALEEG